MIGKRVKVSEIEIFQVGEWASLTPEIVFPQHVSDSDRFLRYYNYQGCPEIQYPYQPDFIHPVLKRSALYKTPNKAIGDLMKERFDIIHDHGKSIYVMGQKFCLYRRRLEALIGFPQDKIVRFHVPPTQIVACKESTLQCFGMNNALSGMLRSGTNARTEPSKTHRDIMSECNGPKFRALLTKALTKLQSSPQLIIPYLDDDDGPKGEDIYDVALGGIVASKTYLGNKLPGDDVDIGLAGEFLFACRVVKFDIIDEFEKMNIPSITFGSSAAVDNLMCALRAWKSHHLSVGSRPMVSVPNGVLNDYLQFINFSFPAMEPVLAPSKHVEIDDGNDDE